MRSNRLAVLLLIVSAVAIGRILAAGPAAGSRPAGKSARKPAARPSSKAARAIADEAATLVSKGEYEKAARIICDDKAGVVSADTCLRAGMGLHCGNASQIKLAIACLKKALDLDPTNIRYRYDLGVTYWNGGYIKEAREECRRVIEKDPGNAQATQILDRAEKMDYSSRIHAAATKRRHVTFTLRTAPGRVPYLAGSWNKEGKIDQLDGWASVPMSRVPTAPADTYRLDADLACESGRWYSAVVRLHAKGAPAGLQEVPQYFCRFPVYPLTNDPLLIRLEDHPTQAPSPFLAPRRALRPPGKASARPRTLLVCIDSDTWDIVMPLVKAGVMPRLEQLMQEGAHGLLHSDPPVSTIIFDRINFGTAGTFGWFDLVRDSLETLKERGIDLIHAGNVAGTTNTWSRLAAAGVPALYASWAELVSYAKGGAETVETCRNKPEETQVGGLRVPSREQKVWSLLDHGEVPAPTTVTHSDQVAEELFDTGVKRFSNSLELLRRRSPEIAFVHFGFVDTSFHLFWDAQDSDVAYLRSGYKPPRRHARVIESLHRLMDLFIGDFAAEVWETGGNILVFSDHGAVGGFAKSWLGHVPEGMLVAAGPAFARGCILRPVPDISALVPTIFGIHEVALPDVYKGAPLPCLKNVTATAPRSGSAPARAH